MWSPWPRHRVDDLLRIAEPAQLLGAADRMGVGVALVVEVVEQPGDPPRLELVALEAEHPLAVPGDRGLDRDRVLAQVLALRPLAEERPGVVA